MTLGTRLYTWLFGQCVGTDEAGNRYYRDRRGVKRWRREKRWVLYKGEPEASRVPPEWHAWLHSIVKDPPQPGQYRQKPWEKPRQPNLTGTDAAYLPPGHILRGGRRERATGDYQPWVPG
ncbi:MAG: NADH:ubiquinone oxidoreductase subunit NDUFA12 [Rhodospirillaceae bacterium]|nr:NADH:ubiquinone oxidoreductase subunit NDUFA12 [Rhodospirillaceae bacterium]